MRLVEIMYNTEISVDSDKAASEVAKEIFRTGNSVGIRKVAGFNNLNAANDNVVYKRATFDNPKSDDDSMLYVTLKSSLGGETGNNVDVMLASKDGSAELTKPMAVALKKAGYKVAKVSDNFSKIHMKRQLK